MNRRSMLFEEAAGGAAAVVAAGGSSGGPSTAVVSPPGSGAPAVGAPAVVTPPAPPAPWHTEWMKPDGTLNPSVYDRLPDDIKHLANTTSLKNSKTVEDVFRKIASLETLAGKKGLGPLPDNAPAEAKAERDLLLRSINGVPEKPEGYGIVKPADLPDAAWNPKSAEAAAAIMHKYNVPPAAARELVASQVGFAKQQIAEQASYEANFFAEQETSFRTEAAKNGMAPDKALDLAERSARRFGIDPEADVIFKNAKVRMALAKVAVAVGEPNLVTGNTAAEANNGMSDNDRAKDIISNHSNPERAIYWDAAHPQHKAVVAKVQALMAEDARKRQVATGARR